MDRKLEYSVLDVFAERPLEGNPLAVFHDARSLTDAEMQALARETNLSETTFLLPGDEAEERTHGVRVRIFTTQEELPFAGHPTLGTASWLYLHHPRLRGAETITLRLNAGPIRVRFGPRAANVSGIVKSGDVASGVVATMQQDDPIFGAEHDRGEVARAIGLSEQDLLPGHAPQTVSTGLPFCIVPLRSVEVSRRSHIDPRTAAAWLANSDAKFFYCVAPVETANTNAAPSAAQDVAHVSAQVAPQRSPQRSPPATPQSRPQGSAQWHARMQFYAGEDPATGSAAGCCIAWLVQQRLAASAMPVVLEQGIEIARPSRITAQATLGKERVHSIMVSGRTIPVADGTFFLP